MTQTNKDLVHLDWLVHSFYQNSSELGDFTSQDVDAVPQIYRDLLAHNQHMTVTVERHHGVLVDVEVLQQKTHEPFYIREILLRRSSDQAVVQYGIVRLFLPALSLTVRDKILEGKIPLGRVLIEHDVLREVRLGEVFKVDCADRLASLLGCLPDQRIAYGRTALIYFNDKASLELLEIVAPEKTL